jgi:hypothetical protein
MKSWASSLISPPKRDSSLIVRRSGIAFLREASPAWSNLLYHHKPAPKLIVRLSCSRRSDCRKRAPRKVEADQLPFLVSWDLPPASFQQDCAVSNAMGGFTRSSLGELRTCRGSAGAQSDRSQNMVPRGTRACTYKSRCRPDAEMSAFGGKAVVKWCCEESPLMTQSGH